ncbi:hypothetical protein L7H29_004386 [Klebsiella pneumoniae]|uniref:hypothetical protein n=1 Tax=Klebsiella pneumoniae TaxID=573 RepID=UPI002731097A|nr:hypothetical protein [Klebsiella pneumoniae]MDP0646330.1 hypothetical protein [Klebsiella pneumoniae]MDP0732332.1 hypothetical protein [Klebsiella pneumoniae]MDP0747893.1 hypothetical protein [Klebsiella pneumoniae]
MAENNFKPFAVGAGANVSSQTDWENLVALSTGFTAGIARSEQINKALRQGTVMASVLAQYIVDTTNSDALDDGDISGLVQKLKSSINSVIPDIPVTSVNGKTGAVTLGAGDVGAYPNTGGEVSGSLNTTGQITEAGQRVYSPNNPPPVNNTGAVIGVRLSGRTTLPDTGGHIDLPAGCVYTGMSGANYDPSIWAAYSAVQVNINGTWATVATV